MDDKRPEFREEQIRKWSQEFRYPQTPDIADAVIRRIDGGARLAQRLRPRLAWAVVVILLLMAALMAVPPVRAQVLEYLQIGAIRIFLAESTPTPTQESTLPPSVAGETGSLIPTNTPRPYPSLVDLAGETTLSEAKSELNFPIQLPTYPSDLGEPDRVFLQDLGGQAALLVWMAPIEPGLIRLDLLLMGPGTFAEKGLPLVLEETTVNSQKALWTEGLHFLHLGGSMYQGVPLVIEGNILIWEQDGITYRLESDLTMDEAVRVAESLN
jgi:hypothetical protein